MLEGLYLMLTVCLSDISQFKKILVAGHDDPGLVVGMRSTRQEYSC